MNTASTTSTVQAPADGLEWLDDPNGRQDQPWLLHSDDATSHHAAFIGNGLLGCRVGEDGDALQAIDGSGSLMAGFWGACRRKPSRPEGQVDLPRWAGFRLFIGDQREPLRLRQRQQTLDLRDGVVTTTGRLATANLQRSCWLAREDKHLAVFTATVTNTKNDGRPLKITCREEFDASNLATFELTQVHLSQKSFQVLGTENRLGVGLALASCMTWSIEDLSRIRCDTRQQNDLTCSRAHTVWLQPGETVTITRYVALARSSDAEDPIAFVQQEVERARADPTDLFERHRQAWQKLWQHRIEVDHPRLQRILNTGLYYLYASLRDDEAWSHGPAGLTNDAWDGTVFWDTELWTLPPIALLQPKLALACARYRFNTLAGARENAKNHDEQGARFAWQSAASGRECCVRPTFIEERHIVSCVARGQWLAAVASGDTAYRAGPGWSVIKECALYWMSRIEVDDDGSCHIRQVCGPDEDAGLVDDNAMTNASAAWTLRLAHRLAEEMAEEPDPRWTRFADALVIPWDDERDIPMQMDGWQDSMTIKQADATLLVHPWRFQLDDAAKARLVDYYRSRYPPNQIMMGVAIDAVVNCQIGRADAAWEDLGQLMPHFHEPYLWVTEAPNNENGCFLTGIGGLLQLVINGFAGVWISDSESLQINPCLPQKISKITIHGLCHNGRTQNLTVSRESEPVRARLTEFNAQHV